MTICSFRLLPETKTKLIQGGWTSTNSPFVEHPKKPGQWSIRCDSLKFSYPTSRNEMLIVASWKGEPISEVIVPIVPNNGKLQIDLGDILLNLPFEMRDN